MPLSSVQNLRIRPLYLHLVVFIGIIGFAFIANHFPKNSVVAAGDFYQLLNPAHVIGRYADAWIQEKGQGSFNTLVPALPFYALFTGLDKLGISHGAQSSWYLLLFFFGSYCSAFCACGILAPKASALLRWAISLLYAFNPITYALFGYSMGFSHHVLIYTIAPLLLAVTYLWYTSPKISILEWQWLIASAILLCLTLTNIAFAVVVVIIIICWLAIMLLTKQITISKSFVYRITTHILIWSFVAGPFFVAYWQSSKEFISNLTSTIALGGDYLHFIKDTSSSAASVLSFNSLSEYLVPYSVPANYLLFGIIFCVLGLAIYFQRKDGNGEITRREYSKYVSCTVVFLLFVMLAMRFDPAVIAFTSPLYSLSPLAILRSPDKILLLLPVLICGCVLFIMNNTVKKIQNYLVVILLLAVFTQVHFFQIHGIIKNLIVSSEKQDYQYIVQVPHEYYQAADLVNASTTMSTVISLPYHVTNSINWANFPAWKFVGQDLTNTLFDHPYITANSYDHPLLETRLSWYEWQQFSHPDPLQLLKLIHDFGGEYILVHNDIPDQYYYDRNKVLHALDVLVSQGVAKKVQNNTYFTLFQIQPTYVEPLVVVRTSDGNLVNAEIKKQSNQQYKVVFEASPGDYTVLLKQSFSSKWVAVSNSKRQNSTLSGSYANQWTVHYRDANDGNITLEYTPQKAINLFLFNQALAVLIVLALGLIRFVKAQKGSK